MISAETDGKVTDYTYGLERISAATGKSRTEYVYDGRGSVIGEVTKSGFLSPAKVTTKAYTPFGEQIGEKTSSFGWNGEYFNATTGQVYLRARFYEPEMNRFSQKDILRGNTVDAHSLNRYLYCENDPINYIDPSGKMLGALTAGGLGTAFAALSSAAAAAAAAVVAVAVVAVVVVVAVKATKAVINAIDNNKKDKTSQAANLAPQSKQYQTSSSANSAKNAADTEKIEVTQNSKTNDTNPSYALTDKKSSTKTAPSVSSPGAGEQKACQARENISLLPDDEKDNGILADPLPEEIPNVVIDLPIPEPEKGNIETFPSPDAEEKGGGIIADPLPEDEIPNIVFSESELKEVYGSIKEHPDYPDDFESVQNGTTYNKVKNQELLEELRKIEPGTWKKVYKDGYDAYGNEISLHYFQSESGKIFDFHVSEGWSN